jgi:hypothetical protein
MKVRPLSQSTQTPQQDPTKTYTMSDQNDKASPPDDKPSNVPSTGTGGTPSDFLKQVVGHQVTVRLNSGVDYRGTVPVASSSIMEICDSFLFFIFQVSYPAWMGT